MAAEESVLMPGRFTMSQVIAGGLQGGDIRRFVGGVGDDQDYVDHRFGGEFRDGCGAYVFNLHGPLAQRVADAVLLADVPLRPSRVRLREPHLSVEPHRGNQEFWFWRIAHKWSIPWLLLLRAHDQPR
jgi:hypothetical protein